MGMETQFMNVLFFICILFSDEKEVNVCNPRLGASVSYASSYLTYMAQHFRQPIKTPRLIQGQARIYVWIYENL